jgi:colanic acid/amylovoran biosynthesis glycosyltransferase
VRRLAYVAGTYPELEETFVTGELRELVRLGEPPPLVFAVIRGTGPPAGAPEAHSYVVELAKPRQLLALGRLLARRPGRTLRALLSPARRFGGRARDMAALAPMALALDGARHIHAHFSGQPAEVAARLSELTGTPFSFTAHAHDLFVEWRLMEEKLRAARFAVTVCEYNRRYVRERVPWAELELVVCGVDVERFRRTTPYPPDGPVAAVGRLVEQKGFEHLVRAAALARGRIPEVIVAGRGQLREPLERLAGELEAPVRFVGDVSHDEVRSLYSSASMAVLPCVVARDGNRDSMPVAVKEAMAMELPVVVSREVGLPELVDDTRGSLVPPGDPEALAAALVELHSLPAAEREALGRAGREFVEEHCNLATETARLRELFGLP